MVYRLYIYIYYYYKGIYSVCSKESIHLFDIFSKELG